MNGGYVDGVADANTAAWSADHFPDAGKMVRPRIPTADAGPTKRASGRIAVKVINHPGDEVMKVMRAG